MAQKSSRVTLLRTPERGGHRPCQAVSHQDPLEYWEKQIQHTATPALSPGTLVAICSLGTSWARRLYPYLIPLETVLFHAVIHGRLINGAIAQLQRQLGWNTLVYTDKIINGQIFKGNMSYFFNIFLCIVCFIFLLQCLNCCVSFIY